MSRLTQLYMRLHLFFTLTLTQKIHLRTIPSSFWGQLACSNSKQCQVGCCHPWGIAHPQASRCFTQSPLQPRILWLLGQGHQPRPGWNFSPGSCFWKSTTQRPSVSTVDIKNLGFHSKINLPSSPWHPGFLKKFSPLEHTNWGKTTTKISWKSQWTCDHARLSENNTETPDSLLQRSTRHWVQNHDQPYCPWQRWHGRQRHCWYWRELHKRSDCDEMWL